MTDTLHRRLQPGNAAQWCSATGIMSRSKSANLSAVVAVWKVQLSFRLLNGGVSGCRHAGVNEFVDLEDELGELVGELVSCAEAGT